VPHFKKEYKIRARDFIRAGEGAIQVQSTLKSIGFEATVLRRASICAYESEMNVVMYGADGSLSLTVDTNEIIIEVKDNGPGIEDIDLALQEGYSTAPTEYREMGFGAGMGLPNMKKNADSFEIHSRKGEGTYLKMCFWVGNSSE
jgi:anti-sigma regulatory factor (Ser/Thr protein kinase)